MKNTHLLQRTYNVMRRTSETLSGERIRFASLSAFLFTGGTHGNGERRLATEPGGLPSELASDLAGLRRDGWSCQGGEGAEEVTAGHQSPPARVSARTGHVRT